MLKKALVLVTLTLVTATSAHAVPTGLDFVFFTGVGTGTTELDAIVRASFPGKTGEGLQTLAQEFKQDPRTLNGQVFPWDQETAAAGFAHSLPATDELVIVGHSFGGDSSLEVAKTLLADRTIDLLVTIDAACVTCPGGSIKPPNVRNEVEIYHDPNSEDSALVKPFLHRLDHPDQSLDVTLLFNEPSNQHCLSDIGGVVTHTNISNSACVHSMVSGAAFSLLQNDRLPDVSTFLSLTSNEVPEPGMWILLGSGVLILWMATLIKDQSASDHDGLDCSGRCIHEDLHQRTRKPSPVLQAESSSSTRPLGRGRQRP